MVSINTPQFKKLENALNNINLRNKSDIIMDHDQLENGDHGIYEHMSLQASIAHQNHKFIPMVKYQNHYN
ncbi:hypothetical protein A3844_04075 [Paenibacillus helianthi]|uniref:Uncharacterized protein n=1 Tax=Paenibacillus helianthi TaxID=1349432 RepID=A0ABX3ESX7_9BACL|nr:hypothetical protein A3842_24645 [Paenibacillus sp. P3E]OKP91031.1 hypothetical protein A3844_04075 [Paenibacillus helianthi]